MNDFLIQGLIFGAAGLSLIAAYILGELFRNFWGRAASLFLIMAGMTLVNLGPIGVILGWPTFAMTALFSSYLTSKLK